MNSKYIKSNSNSKWADYYNYCHQLITIDESNESKIQNIVQEFQQQLLEDEFKMNNNELISDCCIFAPRKRSVLQRKFNLSKRISNTIFKDIHNEVHSVIHYHRLLAKLSRYYLEQEKFINECFDLDIPSDESDEFNESDEFDEETESSESSDDEIDKILEIVAKEITNHNLNKRLDLSNDNENQLNENFSNALQIDSSDSNEQIDNE